MFVKGDILKVKAEYLSNEEKANPKYAEKEYYVRDSWDDKVEVVCAWDGLTGYIINVWAEHTMYKVGHVDRV